ncbi:hypothetical protein [Thermogutta sp.]|uniref:hypothetical protein n=1 Tax=Thermogutta sp. TaxID=1962930 RepID=UPI00321FA35E
MLVIVGEREELDFPQPDSINWHPPEVIVRSLNDEPVLGATWRCSLGYEQVSVTVHRRWSALIGQAIGLVIPTPFSDCPDLVQGYVESVESRIGFSGHAELGVDVMISGIVLASGTVEAQG